MKKILILALVLSGSLLAYGNDSSDDSEHRYESSSGNKYKYDLSDPSDRNGYSVDVGAQMDDSLDPSVDLDRGVGEYGGGIIDDD